MSLYTRAAADTGRRWQPSGLRIAVGTAALVSAVVVAFGGIALIAPELMLPANSVPTSAAEFFGTMVGVRNIALGLTALFVIVARNRVDPRPVLALSAAVQAGDVLAASASVPTMAVAAGICAAVYAASCLLFSGPDSQRPDPQPSDPAHVTPCAIAGSSGTPRQ